MNEAIRAWWKTVFTLCGTVLVLVGTAALVTAPAACKDERCSDYVVFVSAIPGNPSQASCRPGMSMETENRMQGVLVKCTCPK